MDTKSRLAGRHSHDSRTTRAWLRKGWACRPAPLATCTLNLPPPLRNNIMLTLRGNEEAFCSGGATSLNHSDQWQRNLSP
jgi:hypothetical protein